MEAPMNPNKRDEIQCAPLSVPLFFDREKEEYTHVADQALGGA